MYMIYKMKAEELDSRFLRALKAMFKDKEIEALIIASATLSDFEQAPDFSIGW
jgi:hypothetical protein